MANGFFYPPMGNLVLGGVPPEMRGSASGIFSVANRVCLTLGVCLYEALFSQWAPGGIEAPASALAGFRAAYLVAAALFVVGALWILLVPGKDAPASTSPPSP